MASSFVMAVVKLAQAFWVEKGTPWMILDQLLPTIRKLPKTGRALFAT